MIRAHTHRNNMVHLKAGIITTLAAFVAITILNVLTPNFEVSGTGDVMLWISDDCTNVCFIFSLTFLFGVLTPLLKCVNEGYQCSYCNQQPHY